MKDIKTINQKQINELISLGNKDKEIIRCQDHCYRIYSNKINAMLENPTFNTEKDAADYQYKISDVWNFSDDINW